MTEERDMLNAAERAELKAIMADLGHGDLAEWFVGAVNREVAWACEGAPAAGLGQSAKRAARCIEGFQRAADKAEKWWEDMGPSARREIGFQLSEDAIAASDARGPVSEISALFSTTDSEAALIVTGLLARLKSAAEAAAPALLIYSRRELSVLVAENVHALLWHHTGAKRTNPRGGYRRAVNVALLALGRKLGWPEGQTDESSRRGWTRHDAHGAALELPAASNLDDVLAEAYKRFPDPPD